MGERTSYPPGTLSWAELVTGDADAAKSFHTRLFGWEYQENAVDDGHVYSMARRDGQYVAALFEADQPPHWNCYGGYRVIRNGERMNGGIMPAQEGTPANWLPYLGHDDAERLTREIDDLGGKLYNGPVHMPQDTIAVLGDPQGAVFAVWTGRYED